MVPNAPILHRTRCACRSLELNMTSSAAYWDLNLHGSLLSWQNWLSNWEIPQEKSTKHGPQPQVTLCCTSSQLLPFFRTLSSPVPPSVAGIHVVAPPPPLPPPSAISTPRIPVATVGSVAAIRPPQMTPPSTSHAPNQQKVSHTGDYRG